MNQIGLTYNTEKKQIIISEYGRNIQEMIARVIEIEDRAQRTAAAHKIVNVMAQMNPQAKESNDYLHKLWDHLFIMAEGKLDVDAPYEQPKRSVQNTKPHHIDYQNNNIRYGHYGLYVIKMIEKASQEESEEIREALAYSLANQMKKNYLEWNRNVVNDMVIIEDLKTLSKGRLTLPEEAKLIFSSEIVGKSQPQQQKNKQQQKAKQASQGSKKKKVPNMKANMNNPNNPAYKKKDKQ